MTRGRRFDADGQEVRMTVGIVGQAEFHRRPVGAEVAVLELEQRGITIHIARPPHV